MDKERIGIIGGGQLGRMMTTPALEMGYAVRVIDPTPNAPAAQVGAEQIVAGLKDESATRQLAAESHFLTVEIEHINTGILRELSAGGIKVNPSPETLDTIKDKLLQKQFLRNAGIPVADFIGVDGKKDIQEVGKEFGYPFLLKSRFGGYDGRGNALVRDEEQVDYFLQKFDGQALYAERFVPFVKELAIMTARSMSGDIVTYPVVQTVHKNNICHMVFAPASVDQRNHHQAQELGRAAMEHLKGAGVFGIEMFLTDREEIIVNEIAPRVHNSGHYTIEACRTSQFEQHVRAVTGLPLGETDMVTPAAVMVNILGDRQGSVAFSGLGEALLVPQVAVHIYGKADTKPERKMGHITVRANTLEEAEKNAIRARKTISI